MLRCKKKCFQTICSNGVTSWKSWLGTFSLLGILILPQYAVAQPGRVAYQGELAKDGELFDGTADMKFAIVSGGQTLWSNDGTSNAGSEPGSSVEVSADQGIFSVRLGEAPMLAIPAASFQNISDALLRVWVDTGDGFDQLADQPINSSVFALAGEKVRHITTTSSGNVGIGTAGPQSLLDVAANTDSGAQVGAFRVTRQDNPSKYMYMGYDSADYAYIQPVHVGVAWKNLAISPHGGNVGIGTTTPQHQLQIGNAPGDAQAVIVRSYNSATSWAGAFGNSSATVMLGGDNGGVAQIGGHNPTLSGWSNLAINSGGGNVGIGTSTPGDFKLAVNGSAAKPGGGNWSLFSDSRLKHDIRPLAGTLDRLLSMRGYEFEYDSEAVENRLALPGRQIGLLAEEVEHVFPDWVARDAHGYRYLTERATTALMVEALRDLRREKDAQIRARDMRLDRLEADNARLREIGWTVREGAQTESVPMQSGGTTQDCFDRDIQISELQRRVDQLERMVQSLTAQKAEPE